ncbi:diaminopimelate decarboxylase [Saccharopolyspora erythraea NRRL 2338]|uniref:Diaminopimelate decarboxylase n=2 Tax=Saccharopolyspora erythraea TaxID=1836 RepID=A4FN46_SACEN|nr:diaminopimelate decarboxylase [Saccharopolyspora erythraea]EQD83056.1 diaminopimelate decarboxylase [Saccharopolyspora erythraea D]PFG99112.1 diaminopimelate decarboxylase [Saccharopolyspora erythraea NRRL 2338]QRK89071.1 diaminopimelate decarboxylase [Saccharopolyspora erythraea]CAM05471.1 diaminopimelate decarboxylase [Saccharopolyspora erythraea NRRL 2338]
MRAHPAGPRHADVVPPGNTAGPVPATTDDLDRLHPHVWPRNAARAADGSTGFAGVDVRDLAEEYGTPLFVLDEDDFRSRCADYAGAFGDPASVHYASKAFLCTEVARWVAEEGLSLDVCSGGELNVALRAEFPPERITLHGNNKSVPELTAAVEAGVGSVVLDSFHEIARLEHIARERGVRQDVMIRVTVGVEAHTHEFIATAHEDQKFGFSLTSGQAAEAVGRVLKAESLRLVGLHSHIGSQIFDDDGFELAAHRVIRLLAKMQEEHGAEALSTVSTVDLGGGLGIAYTAEDDPLPPAELAARLNEIVRKECENAGLAAPRIAVEPGRAIAGPGTVTVYEVGTIKDVALDGGLQRRYVSVDGGMSDNIRTSLYDAVYDCRLVSRRAEARAVLSRIVGKHCESGDVVVRDCWLPEDIAPGDLVAVAATGAYCYVMASNYNRLPKPAVVAVRDGQARLLLRRETEDDLLRLEV